jgi:predicted AAA+ superfamily ATPase
MALDYRPRIADSRLAGRLRSSGAVLIEGPRASGKTATAARVAGSVFHLDSDASARGLVSTSPETLFDARPPILFDEWQLAPHLWNLVRHEVDDRSSNRGLFILTGSATPTDDVLRHSGAGRFARIRMRPMSLFETGSATGQVSLRGLFDGDFKAALDPGVPVPVLMDQLVIGGWPDLLEASVEDARPWLEDYLQTIVEVDLPQFGARRDPQALRRLLAALGRGVGTDVAVASLAKDVGGPDSPADHDAVRGYLRTLERLMLVDDVPAWAPHMRSATPLRKSPTRYLTDPSLGVAALGVGPQQLLRDLNAAGFHFEAMVVRDLKVYSEPLGGQLAHWRDNSGHEVDVVITIADGRWGAVEVKMNPDDVDKAADSLTRFAAKVDTSKVGEPSFLGVVTTRFAALRRDDGVLVLPVAALGP